MTARHLKRLFALLLLFSNRLPAQNQPIPLRDALKKTTSTFNTQFVYDRQLLDGKTTTYNFSDVSKRSLEDVLKGILYPNDLVFLYVKPNYYTIVSKDKINDAGSTQTPVRKNNEAAGSTAARMKVSGLVTDSAGQGISNVTVAEKGTSNNTITNGDGNFSISVAGSQSELVFSSVGYAARQVAVDNQSTMTVVLQQVNASLGEVVVVGYGSQKRAEVTSAVASVKSENFVKGAVRDAGQLLQGKVAGLTINLPSGDPTSSSQIVLRGTATLATSTQPLILIDGIPGDLNTVAPQDIESIDVLKDGSAAAIYGTRGTNGVILITTKRPKGNMEPTITYSGYASTQSFVRLPKMLSAAEYKQRLPTQALGSNTEWIKEVSRSLPVSHGHSLSLMGGNEQTNYLATLTYRNYEGIFLRSNNRVINGRVDVNHNMFDNKLKINFNILNNDITYNSLGRSASFNNTIFRQALGRNPTAPVRNPDGTWQEQTAIAAYENPLALIDESYGQNELQSTRLSGSVTWLPLDGLQLKALVSRNKANTVYGYAETKQNISTIRDGLQGYASKSDNQSIDQLLELTAQYTKNLGDHHFSVLGGYSYQDNITQSTALANSNFPAGNYSYIDNIGIGRALGSGIAAQSSSKYAYNLIGFFGRITYNYQQKYLLTANLRYEASSKFVGTKDPWGAFPAVSAGWKINKESFMQGVTFFDDLKLRAGYGVTGTAPDQLFLGVSRLGYTDPATGSVIAYLINGQWVPGLIPISNPNPNLKWEVKKEANVGLDFSVLKGRISGSVDYYNRRTNGLLYNYPVPSPPNLYGSTIANVGIMENKGWEVMVNVSPLQSRKLVWTSSVYFSTNRNKLVSLSNDLYQTTNNFINVGFTGSPVQTYTHRVEVGKPIGNFYGYKVLDINTDGTWVYEDASGKASATKVEADKKILGNGLPKYYAGWNNTFRHGRFDLSVTMRGAFGFQILNFQRMYSEVPGFTLYNQLESAYSKIFGKAVLNKNILPEYNSYYVENGDYWKIDNVTIGYNLPIRSQHFSGARVYVSSINTFTITGYKGMDPEVNALGLTPGNDDRDKYPTTRVFTLGFNVSIK